MAYENMTYEFIINRMMNRVSQQYPNLDTREGSILFNALASAAAELAITYIGMDSAGKQTFVDTASRYYILLGCRQMGMDISVFEASAGSHKGVFNVEVPLGSRWNCELYNYVVTEFLEQTEDGHYAYSMLCETNGTEPNNQTGDLIPITDIPHGLEYARLVECIVEGENETSDEDIKTAYYEFVNGTATDGNIAAYERWCTEYDGIGNHKIFPLWNGANTVKVSILSASNHVATEELVDAFQKYLDPNTTGMGDGEAPIGAFVTVTTATEVPINVRANITLKSGYTSTTALTDTLTKYFEELAYADEVTTVSYLGIGARLLACEGVANVTGLLINGGTSDITLGAEEIPTVGTTDWVV